MKIKIRNFVLFTIVALYFIYCLLNNVYIKEQTIYSFEIWVTKIVPSLFPMFIIVDLIYNSNIPYYINKYLHINYIYLLSIISGSPSNAYMLSKYECDVTKLLSVTKYVSPIFLYTYLKGIFSTRIAILLIVANILSNVILIFFIGPNNIEIKPVKDIDVLKVIINSIRNNVITLITILGTVLFFNTLPVSYINNLYVKTALLSLLEITSSFENLLIVNIPLNIKLLFTIISISTCGLCIESQIKSIINDTLIDSKKYFYYRLLHFIIYALLVFLVVSFIL